MTPSTDLRTQLTALCRQASEIISAGDLTSVVSSLDDAEVVDLTMLASDLMRTAERVRIVAAGVISTRSTRAVGRSGLAQSRGHRTATSLLQHLTGSSRGEAARELRVGESLFEEPPMTVVTTVAPGGPGGQSGQGGSTTDNGSDINADNLTSNDAGTDSGTDSGNVSDKAAGTTGASDATDTTTETLVRLPLWHEPLRRAQMNDTISTAQHDAILRGLGEPPAGPDNGQGDRRDGMPNNARGLAGKAAPTIEAVTAWSLAAERLIEEAEFLPAEELLKQARAIRDLLDPEGAKARFLARHEARSFRMWIDAEGLTHGKFVFDDESAAWVRTMIDSALKPRRGGPRFVDPTAKAAADRLVKDPRTNDQLTHDLLIDVLKSGAVADASTVFGVKQAGVRVVQVVNREEYLAARRASQAASRNSVGSPAGGPTGNTTGSSVGAPTGSAAVSSAVNAAGPSATRFEDGLGVLPPVAAEQQRCNSGIVPIIADQHGNPLDVGREQRLYTPKQRIALAARDGGCRWTGCDRPASYCEAHHIDEWHADLGRTDIDRGVLMCRFHHMQLHHDGWKITRDGLGPFLLHPPPRDAQKIGIQNGVVQKGNAQNGVEQNGVEQNGDAQQGHAQQGNGQQGHAQPVELRPPVPLNYAWEQLKLPPHTFMNVA